MIAKIITGTNVKGLLQYLTAKKNEVITLNNILPNLSVNQISKEVISIQALNKRCKKNLMHIVLSFPYNEKLNSCKLKLITEDFLEAFNAKDCMSISYRHFDKNHPHIHCVINKIKSDGTVLSDSFSHIRAKKICRKIEQIYNLQKISNHKQENENTAIKKLKLIIDSLVNRTNSLEEFSKFLLEKEYKVKKGRGIAFINNKNGTKIKGSSIGRNYSLSNLQKRISKKEYNLENEINDIQKIINTKMISKRVGKSTGIQF